MRSSTNRRSIRWSSMHERRLSRAGDRLRNLQRMLLLFRYVQLGHFSRTLRSTLHSSLIMRCQFVVGVRNKLLHKL
ncbi:hypothetical protein ANCCAN_18843, partial [Ancylostoma caninum]